MIDALVVKIVLGALVILAVLAVLRWAWNSRRREGATGQKAEAYEDLIRTSSKREKRVREERSKSHEDWKAAARKRRRKP